MNPKSLHLIPALALILCASACTDTENPGEENETEVITTVELRFAPTDGGAEQVFSWSDPENDGDPVIDDIVLSDALDYDLSVSFLNELADPTEDITEEVDAESDVHQVFFTGSAVRSPSTGDNEGAIISQEYEDTDANGLPVGLESAIATLAAFLYNMAAALLGGIELTLTEDPH